MKKLLNPATFFGSGPVAAKSLELLLEWIDIKAVVTKQTPAHHKEPAPVEELAKDKGIDILHASSKIELDKLLASGSLPGTQFAIVIDYGVIIGQQVIDHYPMGIINSHFSLLPQWRGADPITFALLSGQTKTGVSIMLIDSGMDTGPLLNSKELLIDKIDTNKSLTNKLINLSDDLLKNSLKKYLSKELTPTAQPKTFATYSVMLKKSDGNINTNKPASVIEREVRAFNPWPGSRYQLNDLWLNITKASLSKEYIPQGKLIVKDKRLLLGCNNSSLDVFELKPAGKKNMSAAAFINGYAHILK